MYVCVCDLKITTMRRPRPDMGCNQEPISVGVRDEELSERAASVRRRKATNCEL